MPNNNELKYKITLADLFSGKMANAVKQAEKMDGVMSSIGGRIKQAAIGLGIASVGKQLLDVGTKFDSYQMRLKTLLGTQEMASATFNQIKIDAASTPFDVESLVQANSLLISAGLSATNARKDVLGLANAIAATGGDETELSRMAVNMQQIKNLGKATALDIKQFAFAGIPIYKLLSESMGVSIAKVREMDITYDQLTKAFEKASMKGGMFYKGLENQSKTVGGQISNLKDKFSFFLYDLYNKAKPAIIMIIDGLSKLLDLITKFFPVIKMAVTLWGAYIVKMRIAKIESFNFALAQRAMAMGMSKSAVATGFLARGIRGIGHAIKAVPIVGWILAIAEGISYLWDNFEGFRTAIYSTIEQIKAMGDTLVLMFKASWYAIKGTITGDKKMMRESVILNAQAAALQMKAAAVGIQKGKDSFAKDHAPEQSLESLEAASMGKNSLGGNLGSGSSSSGSALDISSARPQNINITVNGGLVGQMTIATTTIKEGAQKIKEVVSTALMEVLNDANAMARA